MILIPLTFGTLVILGTLSGSAFLLRAVYAVVLLGAQLAGISYRAALPGGVPPSAQQILRRCFAVLLWLLCLPLAAGGLLMQPMMLGGGPYALGAGGYLVVTSVTLIFLAAAVIPPVLVVRHLR